MKKSILVAVLAAHSFFAVAQKQAPQNWFNLDPKKDKFNGVSTERAYSELLKGKQGKQIIVAVIDGGTEVNHEDLRDVIWINPGEIAGNGIDDDRNGYVDDINGWNFIGGSSRNIDEDNLEVTRIYRNLKEKYAKVDTTALEGEEAANYQYYKKIKADYQKGFNEYSMYVNFYKALGKGAQTIASAMGKDSMSMDEFKKYKPADVNESLAQKSIEQSFRQGKKNYVVISKFSRGLDEAKKEISKFTEFLYNPEFDPRAEIVGDNYENAFERYYGNNKVSEPNGDHGTHVAGIIAAIRTNNIGMQGVADNVRIMVVRVVPDGDERDKDVANGIRYAVDMGAKVINMSFGKAYSPYKGAVDEAVKYALSKDVLLIHAAGNDNKNTDSLDNFPNDRIEGYSAANWIEVGASGWKKKKEIPAEFSNYAAQNVDVFAPGVDIYSSVPESKYASFNGTSMAAPVTAGVAAVIRSYYPQFTAAEVKSIITGSVVKVKGKVYKPGTKNKVSMTELCNTGGIVNLYEAIKLAEQRTKK